MAIERTLSIIKPDAVAKNVIGQIYARFEGAGLKIVAARMARLSSASCFFCSRAARLASRKASLSNSRCSLSLGGKSSQTSFLWRPRIKTSLPHRILNASLTQGLRVV